MSAFGTKRTSPSCGPHMSAFGGKADICFAPHMSAFDPKRTSTARDPFRSASLSRYRLRSTKLTRKGTRVMRPRATEYCAWNPGFGIGATAGSICCSRRCSAERERFATAS